MAFICAPSIFSVKLCRFNQVVGNEVLCFFFKLYHIYIDQLLFVFLLLVNDDQLQDRV